ncbi:unnamed protein product [Parnassius mnemosyne]|uniref:Reverse transcriptase n=1 Tax=Parnassius mnemosyne TaxID=213953 RepID=A0AAV1LHZ1_9NEOP
MIEGMVKDCVIEPSSSPWCSPVVLVKKKDGSMRFCVDYRRLNDVTKKDSYPLPRIDDTLDMLTGVKWFSTLDLKSGYWQVEIASKDKEKTTFSTGKGLLQFKVMPFGLCNAPATFERLMELVLTGLIGDACLVYLDDIIIVGRTFEELKDRLCKTPISAYPYAGKEFIVDTDASDIGLGGVLSQRNGDQEVVIAYFRKWLSNPERNYCFTRRELLAVVKSLQHFSKYLLGQKFHLRTDHAAQNGYCSYCRWIDLLQEYDFVIEHRSVKSHGNADALTRRPCPEDCKHCTRQEGKEVVSVKTSTTMSGRTAYDMHSRKIRTSSRF